MCQGYFRLDWSVFVSALKLASWETLKDEEFGGGSLAKEEVEELTMQALYATVGLSAAVIFLAYQIIRLAAESSQSGLY